MENVLQIQKDSFEQIEIKKSKFLCFSFLVQTKQQAEDIVKSLNDKYSDATHVCYAYVVAGQEKACDNGEPQGTAGKPILDCIKRKNLKNVLVVVVRYFGGIKLGAGGLIRAYSNSAKTVLDASGTKQQIATKKLIFETEFSNQKLLQKLMTNNLILGSEINYQQTIKVTVFVLPINQTEIYKIIKEFLGQNICIICDENIYYM